jgi:predicted metal-binding protein
MRDGNPARVDLPAAPAHVSGMENSSISATVAPWRQVALVCGKCSRKLGGGFGKKGKHDLADVLKDAAKAAGQRRAIRVMEVGCLGLCPKRAVSAVSSAKPDEVVVVVPAGAEGSLVLARLMGGNAASPSPSGRGLG